MIVLSEKSSNWTLNHWRMNDPRSAYLTDTLFAPLDLWPGFLRSRLRQRQVLHKYDERGNLAADLSGTP